jgi:hypothetical protein
MMNCRTSQMPTISTIVPTVSMGAPLVAAVLLFKVLRFDDRPRCCGAAVDGAAVQGVAVLRFAT